MPSIESEFYLIARFFAGLEGNQTSSEQDRCHRTDRGLSAWRRGIGTACGSTQFGPAPRAMRCPRYVILFGFFAAGTASGDYRDDYVLGLKAVKEGDWVEAETRMRAALAEKPEAVERLKLYGMRIEAYVPQYYLGQAALRRGDCDSATSYWTSDGAKQVIDSLVELRSEVENGLARCRGGLAQAKPRAASDRPLSREPSLSERALPEIERAAVSDDLIQPSLAAEKRPESAATNSVTPLTEAVATPPGAEQVRGAAPLVLVAMVDAYLQGRFDDVISVNPLELSEDRARYHALVLRAASRHTEYLSIVPADASRLAAVVSDIRRAKALLPKQSLDPILFSPRFRELYASVKQ